MERLTSKRAQGPGYWTPHKKDELTQRLGAYEDTGRTPEQINDMVTPLEDEEFREYLEYYKEDVERYKADGLGYVSITCQLVQDVLKEEARWVLTVDQLKQIFALAK